nr:S-layer protein [Candidatus Anammoximicrobium sp.]
MIRYLGQFGLVLLLLPAASVGAESFLVVNFGAHPSPEEAGLGEAQVNWLDADRTDDTICTACFAALELQRYLRKLTGRADDFSIVDDDSPPSGELILVGGPESNAASRQWAAALGINAQQLDALGPEGYRLKTAAVNGRRITLIAGGGRIGTLYGAYDLLYRQGVRWFAPGELHEEVPSVQ